MKHGALVLLALNLLHSFCSFLSVLPLSWESGSVFRVGPLPGVGRRICRVLPHPVHLGTDILASKQNDTDLIPDAHKKLKPTSVGMLVE